MIIKSVKNAVGSPASNISLQWQVS